MYLWQLSAELFVLLMICRKWGVWKACAKTVAQDKQPHCGGPRGGRWGWYWHPLGGWLVSSLNKSCYGGLSGDSLIFSLYENSVHWWDKCVGVSSHYTKCNTIMPMSLTAFVHTSGLSKRWWPGEGWFCTGDLWREDRLKFRVSSGVVLFLGGSACRSSPWCGWISTILFGSQVCVLV